MPVVSPSYLAVYERGEISSSPFPQSTLQSAIRSAAYASAGDDRIVRGTRGPRLRELTYRYQPRTDADGRPIYLGPAATNPAAIVPTLKRLLAHEAVEVFGVLCLTTRRRILCWHQVSRGSIDRASVNVRDVFIPALMINAPAIVLAHNHPSGDPEPSDADVELTEQLLHAGRVMGIDIVDHVVVSDGAFVSLALRGLRTPRTQPLSA
jgi:DNA repair protein RadC